MRAARGMGVFPVGGRRVVVAMAGLALAAAAFVPAAARAQSERSLLREGNRQYDKEQFPDAEVSYRKALEKADDPVTAQFNLGDALFRQKRYEEAARQYESAASSASAAGRRDVAAQARHNLGNALLEGGKVAESIEAYKEALRIDPSDEDTRYNLEYARRLLRRQEEQQQQQQQQKDRQGDQQEKDQRKDQQEKDKRDGEEKRDDQDRKDQSDQQSPRREKQDQKKEGKPDPRQANQIPKADAERILEALKKQEQDVKKKLQKQTPVRVGVEKDW